MKANNLNMSEECPHNPIGNRRREPIFKQGRKPKIGDQRKSRSRSIPNHVHFIEKLQKNTVVKDTHDSFNDNGLTKTTTGKKNLKINQHIV